MADETRKMVLIGGGGHCKSVLDTLFRLNRFSEIVITDPCLPVGTEVLGCRVAGDDGMLPELFAAGFRNAFVTVGSIKSTDRRRDAYTRAVGIGFVFPAVMDPSAVVADSATVADGVYIGKNAVVNADAVIGTMAIINTGAVIEHDCRVGEFTHVAVGVVVCGGAEIGKDAFVGANATIIQGVRIGMKSIIGAGSVVCGDVPEHGFVRM